MNDYNPHSVCQHGFCKHRSCVNKLLHVVADLSDMFNNGDPYDINMNLKKPLIRSQIEDWLQIYDPMA